jgi:hypothetical protein
LVIRREVFVVGFGFSMRWQWRQVTGLKETETANSMTQGRDVYYDYFADEVTAWLF